MAGNIDQMTELNSGFASRSDTKKYTDYHGSNNAIINTQSWLGSGSEGIAVGNNNQLVCLRVPICLDFKLHICRDFTTVSQSVG